MRTRSLLCATLLLTACTTVPADDGEVSSDLVNNAGWFLVEQMPNQATVLRVRGISGGMIQCDTGVVAQTCPVQGFAAVDRAGMNLSTQEDALLRGYMTGDGILAQGVIQQLGGGNVRVTLQQVWRATAPAVRTSSTLFLAHMICTGGGLSACPRGWSNVSDVGGPQVGGTVGTVDLSHVGATAADRATGDSLIGTAAGTFVSAPIQVTHGSTTTSQIVCDQLWLPFVHTPIPLDAKATNVTVPANLVLHAGQQLGVGVTMQNVGSTTWTAAAGFKLGSQDPQDNSTWGMNRVGLAPTDSVAPGASHVFNFTITAPVAPGTYHFQWKMVQESIAWFGTPSDNVDIVVDVLPCAGLDPTGVQPAAAGIQACIDAAPVGGTVAIPPGTYDVDNQILVNKAITLTTFGVASTAPDCENVACAVLKAAPAFNAPPTGGWQPPGIRAPLMVQSDDVTLRHLYVDGNRATRLASWAAQQCAAGDNAYGYNIMVFGAHVSIMKSVTARALCGTGMGWLGDDATITDNVSRDNGDHALSGMWSDGMTILRSDRMVITGNHVINGSDVALILFGGRDAHIANNHVEETTGAAFAGLMLFHEQSDPLGGDFTNTIVTNNLVECHQHCELGLHIGGRPWETGAAARVYGGIVTGNTVHDSPYGVTVTNAGTAAVPVQVYGNTATGAYRTHFRLCGVGATSGGANYDVGPGNDVFGQPTDSFVDFHNDPPSQWSHYSMCRQD